MGASALLSGDSSRPLAFHDCLDKEDCSLIDRAFIADLVNFGFSPLQRRSALYPRTNFVHGFTAATGHAGSQNGRVRRNMQDKDRKAELFCLQNDAARNIGDDGAAGGQILAEAGRQAISQAMCAPGQKEVALCFGFIERIRSHCIVVFGHCLARDDAAGKNEVFVIGQCKFRALDQRIFASPRGADNENEPSTARYFFARRN